MKVTKYLSILFPLLCILVFSETVNAQKKIVGYVIKNSSPELIDYSRVTHINIAFENPDSDGNLSYHTGNDALIKAAHAKNVKVLVSVCGGGVSMDPVMQKRYFNLMRPENRDSFISKINSYLQIHNLDGIDLDLEGPSISSDYSDFVIALKKVLAGNKLLTAALSHDNGGDKVSSLAIQSFDFLNIMAYDKNWGKDLHHSTFAYAVECMNWWIENKGLLPEKAILGVPFYGYTNIIGEGGIGFSDISSSYGEEAAKSDQWKTGNNIIFYNGIPTIRQKSQFVVDNNYGGIMIWQLAQDAKGSYSLLKNIEEVLNTAD